MADHPSHRVESPCIGNCCLDEEDICMGCCRSLTEITGWSAATEAEKLEIIERCQTRREARER